MTLISVELYMDKERPRLMKQITKIVLLFVTGLLPVLAQNSSDQPASLGDAARELKSANKAPARAKFSNETAQVNKPLIPDVAALGKNNLDDILQGIDSYRSAHKLPETEAAIRNWYDHQIALRIYAIRKNNVIAQRQQARETTPTDVQPNIHDQYVNLRRTEESTRRDEDRQTRLNERLIDRIQQDLISVRSELQKRYEMN